jgi:RNA polymerase sigma-70 factor (ECF subfamily)
MEVPGTRMHELAFELPADHMSNDAALEREFQERLAETATLAFRVAYAVLRHREDAEDVAQEAMVLAYRSFARLQDRGAFRSWLVRIVWRTALNRRRRDARRTSRELAVVDPPAGASVEDLMLSREFQEHLWRAVDRLPDRLRSVVLLTAMQGHEIREVAQMLDVPEGTVKSRLYQARKVLTEKLRWLVIATHGS